MTVVAPIDRQLSEDETAYHAQRSTLAEAELVAGCWGAYRRRCCRGRCCALDGRDGEPNRTCARRHFGMRAGCR